MAKEGIHPDYHEINIVMTDGTKYKTRSCWGKAGDTLTLDVDPKTHPAWVGGVNLKKTGRMEKFSDRFGGLSIANLPGAAAVPAAEKKAEAKAEPKSEAKKDEKKKADKK